MGAEKSLEIEYTPKKFNDGDWSNKNSIKTEFDDQMNGSNWTQHYEIATPKVGPLNFFIKANFASDGADHKTISGSLATKFEDYHLGVKASHDSKVFTDIETLAVLKNAKGDFFFKADVLEKHFAIGCNHIHGTKAHHAYELQYAHGSATKALFGHPVALRWGGIYNLTEHLTFKATINAGEDKEIGSSIESKFNDRLTVEFSDNFNFTKATSEDKTHAYHFGVNFKYSL